MMHDQAKQRYESMIRDALPWPSQVDVLLDQYADSLLRATNWDADQWGLPTAEMLPDLTALIKAAGGARCPFWPREAI